MEAINNKELILALEELEKEKGIKKEYVLESIESALVLAYKRNFDSLENVKVVMDKKTGVTHLFSSKGFVSTGCSVRVLATSACRSISASHLSRLVGNGLRGSKSSNFIEPPPMRSDPFGTTHPLARNLAQSNNRPIHRPQCLGWLRCSSFQ